MLKRLEGGSSNLAQNKLFLPGFPATSLLFPLFSPPAASSNPPWAFDFFSSPQQLTETLSLSPHLNQRRPSLFCLAKDKPENSSSSSPLSQPV